MKRLIFFYLTGRFAHFKFPYTSPNFLKKSFSIPPRTTVLGLLGSILGVNGFQQYDKESEPEYYNKLKHIPLVICMLKMPQKMLIIYNSLNSFGKNISENPNVMIEEEILLNPEYRIGLLLDDLKEIDMELIKTFTKKSDISSKFHLYLGKNEFFANIGDVNVYEEGEFSIESKNEVEQINSIIPVDLIDLTLSYENIIYDSFSKNILFRNKKLETQRCQVAYFLGKERETNIELTKDTPLLNINGEYYYLFDDDAESST